MMKEINTLAIILMGIFMGCTNTENRNYSVEGSWAGVDHNSRYVEISITENHWYNLIMENFISSSYYEYYQDSLFIYLSGSQQIISYHIYFVNQDSVHMSYENEFYHLTRIPNSITTELNPQNRDVLRPFISRMFQVHRAQFDYPGKSEYDSMKTEIPEEFSFK